MALFWQIVIVCAFVGEMGVAIMVAALAWKDVRELLHGLGGKPAAIEPPAADDASPPTENAGSG